MAPCKVVGDLYIQVKISKIDLFKSLLNSLDSQPEKIFTQYYTIYQNVNEYPVLIPQVYIMDTEQPLYRYGIKMSKKDF